jgi:arginase family enzyme
MVEAPHRSDRSYHVLGVPLRTGSLYPGSENDAQPYRDVQLIARLQAAGCRAVDEGDVAIPSYLPHHAIPPIRSWPGPRIAWDCVSDRLVPLLQQPGQVPLLIGCDCSVVVGTTQALRRAGAEDIHVIYVDGDFDDAEPVAGKCQSAAALAVWLLTRESPFWAGPPLAPSQVTVIGWTNPPDVPRVGAPQVDAPQAGVRSISLADVRRHGALAAARRVLERIPASASVVLHFDIDVFRRRDMPAAYFPHDEGLSLAEGTALAVAILQDPRIRVIEMTEYASLRDLDQRSVGQLVDLLVEGLER